MNCRDKILDFSSPCIMGILNVTEDSFFDGGKYIYVEQMLKQVEKMVSHGLDIIDIGACSTRPGAKGIGEKQELEKLIPAVAAVRENFPLLIISIDTFRANVASEAVKVGADMINDISGSAFEDKIPSIITDLQIPYVLMHISGTTETMHTKRSYENIISEIYSYFSKKSNQLLNRGLSNIIIDPGFGFGKSLENNYKLLLNLKQFKSLGLPLLAGLSRKSFINKLINSKPKNSLNGTTVVNTIALLNGANILRVHDVKEAKEAVEIVGYMKQQQELRS